MAVDWFCGDGGMSYAMHQAGFRVVGVDIVRRASWAYGRHVKADITQLGPHDLPPAVWDHWSPPCQRFSYARGTGLKDVTEDDVALLRHAVRLRDARRPRFWSIENVKGSIPFFTPILGPPRFVHGPFVFWGNFPPFAIEARGILRKGMAHDQLNMAKSHRQWTRSALPFALVGPMARAVYARVADSAF